jgi:hypothetical protein
MIPHFIEREHVLAAIERVNIEGIPKKRGARSWALQYNKRRYPVKLLISWAHEFYNGQELEPSKFISTEARSFLNNLNFTIITT